MMTLDTSRSQIGNFYNAATRRPAIAAPRPIPVPVYMAAPPVDELLPVAPLLPPDEAVVGDPVVTVVPFPVPLVEPEGAAEATLEVAVDDAVDAQVADVGTVTPSPEQTSLAIVILARESIRQQ